ncbi:MAG TPA: PAS domain S-box protein [Campylobacterales bacterium]|nr:PAS domain S-box protein [Campylobacterales bacterium]
MIYRPIAIDQEIAFSKKKFIVSKTDPKGNIIFVNKNLCEISGYTEEELIGTSHSIFRHPDMPRAVFFLVWNSLLRGEPVSGVVKNLAKSGEYYWVIADFDVKRDSDGNIKSFTAFRRAAPQQVIDEVEELYDAMLKIEKKHGMEGALAYFEAFLEERQMNYEEFLNDLVSPKGIMAKLFSAFKQMLG